MIIWLASYPKSGNTWVRLFLNKLLYSRNVPLDINNIQIQQFPNKKHFNLQETLCNEIANFCLSKSQVRAVKVITKKVDVYQNCDAVGFEIFISKDEKKIK